MSLNKFCHIVLSNYNILIDTKTYTFNKDKIFNFLLIVSINTPLLLNYLNTP